MRNIDILLDADFGLVTASHDIAVGDVTLQNQALILDAHKGEWKERPMIGCGIADMVNDDDSGFWKRSIREELGRDHIRVKSLKIKQDNITIDADYENN